MLSGEVAENAFDSCNIEAQWLKPDTFFAELRYA